MTNGSPFPELPDPWFFMSYSKTDGDEILKQFYHDLATEVRRLVAYRGDPRPSAVGFMDESSIQTGESWEGTLAEALQRSRTLVCIYSPGYFTSPFCGKEFEVFAMRLRQHIANQPPQAPPPSIILPVLWDPPIGSENYRTQCRVSNTRMPNSETTMPPRACAP